MSRKKKRERLSHKNQKGEKKGENKTGRKEGKQDPSTALLFNFGDSFLLLLLFVVLVVSHYCGFVVCICVATLFGFKSSLRFGKSTNAKGETAQVSSFGYVQFFI